tara:strand:- start:6025 stop:6333 length:309 start_codon:yes stop_codon:yes gene_type:complete
MHTIFGGDFKKGSNEYKYKKIYMISEGQEINVLNRAINWAREHKYNTLIVTQRKIAKEDGEIGRIYVKNQGGNKETTLNMLRNQPRSSERKGWYQRKAMVIS